jgi:hypothetical protein
VRYDITWSIRIYRIFQNVTISYYDRTRDIEQRLRRKQEVA